MKITIKCRAERWQRDVHDAGVQRRKEYAGRTGQENEAIVLDDLLSLLGDSDGRFHTISIKEPWTSTIHLRLKYERRCAAEDQLSGNQLSHAMKKLDLICFPPANLRLRNLSPLWTDA
jgi:hypothetical protein